MTEPSVTYFEGITGQVISPFSHLKRSSHRKILFVSNIILAIFSFGNTAVCIIGTVLVFDYPSQTSGYIINNLIIVCLILILS